ncbi:hypothetical protein BK135_24100 [Paenibacillus peoriae]|nr:hypothetical protein BK135_24100 [Paenibacillus peoriae]
MKQEIPISMWLIHHRLITTMVVSQALLTCWVYQQRTPMMQRRIYLLVARNQFMRLKHNIRNMYVMHFMAM